MGFSQALSGLNTSSDNLSVISNNISNSQTVGFKSSTTVFADIYAGSQVGLGVKTADVVQNFSSGTLETTDRDLDLAISGNGFFVFDQNGQAVYSRNGQLTLTSEGYLENSAGAKLQGVNGVIQIPSSGMQASATANVDATLNLDSNSSTIDRTTTSLDTTDSSTYSYANTATIYDSLGNSHTMTMYFTKTGVDTTGGTSTWEVQVAVDGTLLTNSDGTAQSQTLTFDSSGNLSGTDSGSYSYDPSNGAASLAFTLDMSGTTQFGNDSEMSSLSQDGYTSGSLVSFSIDESGNVIASYSNDQTQVVDQIELATFANEEGLESIGDNEWAATSASGQAITGTAGVGQLGSIESGVTESSNVDLTQELVNLIIAQRTYQANAQSVKTQSQVLEQAVSLGN